VYEKLSTLQLIIHTIMQAGETKRVEIGEAGGLKKLVSDFLKSAEKLKKNPL